MDDSMVPRTDAGARKLIERVDAVASRLDGKIASTDEDVLDLKKSVNRRFKQKVGWFGLIAILGGSGGAVVTFSVNAANETRKEMVEARKQLAEDVRQVRTEQGVKVNALYDLFIEQKSRSRVKAETEKITEEK